jgi:SAM-dependent methyltransferase
VDLIEVSNNENRHPWEISRIKCILTQLKKFKIQGTILDIGCGDSYFDKCLIKSEPNLTIYGVDINLTNEFHKKNLHALNSLNHLPNIKFDFIIMMDVLEHIEDDKSYLENILKLLKPEGIVFITVPAFMRLYSLHDKELLHYRRYEHKKLHEMITACGLKEVKWSYFYFSLIIGRLITMNKTENLSSWQRSADNFITKFITAVLNLDFKILSTLSNIGIHMPGLSLMSVCCINQNKGEIHD